MLDMSLIVAPINDACGDSRPASKMSVKSALLAIHVSKILSSLEWFVAKSRLLKFIKKLARSSGDV
jgi:hypothetical protein